MNEEDLAGLSDEERAALEDEDEGAVASGDEDEEDESGDESAATAAKDDAGDDTESGDADSGDAAEEAAAPVVADEFRPELRAEAPEGADEKIASIDAATAELVTKFRDGEIDMAEFMSGKAHLDNERVQLVIASEQAKFAERQNNASREQRWQWEQERFFGAEANKETYKDAVMIAALDAQVKQLANDPANGKRAAGWFLEEADRLVRARFGGTKAAAPQAKTRQPDLSVVPKTLAGLPAAELPETGDAEFAYLDKLDGIELENVVAKMTPEQERRYLMGAAA